MDITTEGATLILSGDFDVRSTGVVRSAIDAQLDLHHPHPITIDLTAVGSVDATALRVLAAASRRASRDGQRIVLRGACPAVRRMLHLTRLMRLVELQREPIPA